MRMTQQTGASWRGDVLIRGRTDRSLARMEERDSGADWRVHLTPQWECGAASPRLEWSDGRMWAISSGCFCFLSVSERRPLAEEEDGEEVPELWERGGVKCSSRRAGQWTGWEVGWDGPAATECPVDSHGLNLMTPITSWYFPKAQIWPRPSPP